jgi:hypothetical protein
MKDFLQDLIQHTSGLGVVDLIKVVGSTTETLVTAIADDKSVVVSGKFKTPNLDFIGTFGMPNLSKLKTILSFEEYDQSSVIYISRVERDGEKDVPSTIHFETKNGDFINDYRLMSKSLIEERVRNVNFRGTTWNVTFEPTVSGIMRLKKQASAHAEESNFSIRTDKNDLKIYFGDPSTHSGSFVFHSGVAGSLTKNWMWPVKAFSSIMDLPGDKVVSISDQGATEITVDSGLAIYQYLLPAQAK